MFDYATKELIYLSQ